MGKFRKNGLTLADGKVPKENFPKKSLKMKKVLKTKKPHKIGRGKTKKSLNGTSLKTGNP